MMPAPLVFLALSTAQSPEDLRSIVGHALVGGQATAELRSLADVGPRMSGTKAYDRAVEWAESRFRAHGLAVRLEPVSLAAAWRRGPARARIVSPFEMELVASSVGWSPPTAGTLRGRVQVLSDLSPDRIAQANLAGSIVLFDTPEIFRGGFTFGSKRVERALVPLKKAGVRAILFPFNDMLKGHRHFGAEAIAPLPMIGVQRDVGRWLKEAAAKQAIEIEVRNDSAAGKAATVKNVIAELPGRGDGWLLAGAHLDTWDVTIGAQDNATGVAEVIEAARILSAHARAFGPPRRTIRFALWAAEEIGLAGSRAFVSAHEKELGSCVAVINTDAGAGELRGWHINGRKDIAKSIAPLADRLSGIGASEISHELIANTDTLAFWLRGVPALELWVEEDRYFDVHHRPTDSIDRVRGHRVALGAAAIAAMAWMLAESPQVLGPQLSEKEVTALIDELGMSEALGPVFSARLPRP